MRMHEWKIDWMTPDQMRQVAGHVGLRPDWNMPTLRLPVDHQKYVSTMSLITGMAMCAALSRK